MGSKIQAIEYVNAKIKLTNDDLSTEFPGYNFSSFEKKIGIKSRYVVDNSETALDLAVKACEKLFSSIDRQQVDYIIYCTQSPEYFLPTTACILQDRLGLRRDIGAFDYNLGCSGYTYGLSLAKSIINTGQALSILLVTAETYSKYLHPKDRTNRSIFGDAASASLITSDSSDSIGTFCFGTDGSGWDKLIVKNGAAKFPYDNQALDIEYGTDNIYSDNHLYMNGPEVLNFTNSVVPNLVYKTLERNGLKIDEVDQFIFHQANAFMLNTLRKRLEISSDRFYINLAETGNTVSNTIPIALKEYSNKVNSEKEEKILVVGFGVGLSWCAGVLSKKTNL